MMLNQWSISVHVVARYSRPPVERKVMEESWLTWFRVRSPPPTQTEILGAHTRHPPFEVSQSVGIR